MVCPERHPVSALKEMATRGRCWSVFLQPPAQPEAKKQQRLYQHRFSLANSWARLPRSPHWRQGSQPQGRPQSTETAVLNPAQAERRLMAVHREVFVGSGQDTCDVLSLFQDQETVAQSQKPVHPKSPDSPPQPSSTLSGSREPWNSQVFVLCVERRRTREVEPPSKGNCREGGKVRALGDEAAPAGHRQPLPAPSGSRVPHRSSCSPSTC